MLSIQFHNLALYKKAMRNWKAFIFKVVVLVLVGIVIFTG